MVYIVFDKRVVSDSSGKPREFKNRQAARSFIRGRLMLGEVKIVDKIDGIIGRHRVNLTATPGVPQRGDGNSPAS